MPKQNDDMSECKAAENTAATLSQRWIAYVLFFLVFAYNMRYIIMQRFLEQQLSKKQQEQLQNFFDYQRDGVLIFSKNPV